MRFVFKQDGWGNFEEELYWYSKSVSRLERREKGYSRLTLRRIFFAVFGMLMLAYAVRSLIRYGVVSGTYLALVILMILLGLRTIVCDGLLPERLFAHRRARIRSRSGDGNGMFVFEENMFRSCEDDVEWKEKYETVRSVMRHGDFLYLHAKPGTMFCVELNSITEGSVEEFVRFLKEKCGEIEEF